MAASCFVVLRCILFCILLTISLRLHTQTYADGEGTSAAPDKYQVDILNGCDRASVRGSCGSPDNGGNVGQFLIGPSQIFGWTFLVKPRTAHSYECNFRVGNADRGNFVVFERVRDAHLDRCKRDYHCYWKVTEHAIHFSNDFETWHREHNFTLAA